MPVPERPESGIRVGGSAPYNRMVVAVEAHAWQMAEKKALEEGIPPIEIISKALAAYCR
jgi:methanogenic corrinoid protein MtbC1